MEPIDEVLVKYEPYEESYPEFVEVSNDLYSPEVEVKNEDVEEAIEPGLTLLRFNSSPVQQNVRVVRPARPVHVINYIQETSVCPRPRPHLNIKHQHTDLSIFWKPFQEQPKKSISLQSQLVKEVPRPKAWHLLHSICTGQTGLSLPPGFNMYFIKDTGEINLLIALMGVDKGLPVMKHQIIVNTALQVSLFYGTRRVTNIELCDTLIKTANCISSVVTNFSGFNWCRGLSSTVRIERWPSLVMLETYQNRHVFRQSNCTSVHRGALDQCGHCRFLEARDKKYVLVKRKRYLTFSMLANYKYWQSMKLGVGKLKKKIKRLQEENVGLKRKLRRAERGQETDDEVHTSNLKVDEIKVEIDYEGALM